MRFCALGFFHFDIRLAFKKYSAGDVNGFFIRQAQALPLLWADPGPAWLCLYHRVLLISLIILLLFFSRYFSIYFVTVSVYEAWDAGIYLLCICGPINFVNGYVFGGKQIIFVHRLT